MRPSWRRRWPRPCANLRNSSASCRRKMSKVLPRSFGRVGGKRGCRSENGWAAVRRCWSFSGHSLRFSWASRFSARPFRRDEPCTGLVNRYGPGKVLVVIVAVLLCGTGPTFGKRLLVYRGTWIGTYGAAQGTTGMALVLNPKAGGLIKGKWIFYADASNPGVPSGWTYVKGWASGAKVYVRSYRWGLRPGPNWQFLALRGRLSRDRRHIVGRSETLDGYVAGHLRLRKR